ncbi:MAG: cytochrome c oxidase subunit II, partial [Actinobacteria bacterium]|nr:cytochrome c oxidase subunit II [Actinomycetota bacterium]
LLGGAAVLLAACGDNPQSALHPEGPNARTADGLFRPVFWIAVGVFFLVEGLLVVAVIRFRQRRGRERRVKQVHGNTRLEVVWTLIPALLLAGISVPTVATIFELSRRPSGNVLEITVTGKQWWWDVQYPGLELRTANEVHIPVGRPVYLTLKSDDVIHSFWVPKLAGKQDLVPGHEEFLNIGADRPGVYLGQCAEFCGLSHANMRFRVVAQTEGDFQQWVAEQQQAADVPQEGLASRGFEIFMRPGLCASCHAVGGTDAQAIVGPDLTHLFSRETLGAGMFELSPETLAQWLRDTPSVKPGSKMPDYGCEGPSTPVDGCLSDEEIAALIAFLETLT